MDDNRPYDKDFNAVDKNAADKKVSLSLPDHAQKEEKGEKDSAQDSAQDSVQEIMPFLMCPVSLRSGAGVINYAQPRDSGNMWLVTFTDMMALMLTFFVLLYSMSAPQEEQWSEMSSALQGELQQFEAPRWYQGGQDAINIRKIEMSNGLNLDYLERLIESALNETDSLKDAVLLPQRDHMIIALPSDLLFAPGRADVGEQGQRALYVLGGVLSKIRNRIEVVGHTDPRPITSAESPFASNWELSVARAASVAGILSSVGYDKLVGVRGMSSARYDELSEEMPAEQRLDLARRVDIAIYRDDGARRGFLNFGN